MEMKPEVREFGVGNDLTDRDMELRRHKDGEIGRLSATDDNAERIAIHKRRKCDERIEQVKKRRRELSTLPAKTNSTVSGSVPTSGSNGNINITPYEDSSASGSALTTVPFRTAASAATVAGKQRDDDDDVLVPNVLPLHKVLPWHKDIDLHLRNDFIQKLIQVILPKNIDLSMVRDTRMKNLVAKASKMEGDIYEAASSQEEYYYLLAEKIYQIQKELEEKRVRRAAASASGGAPLMQPQQPQQPQPNAADSGTDSKTLIKCIADELLHKHRLLQRQTGQLQHQNGPRMSSSPVVIGQNHDDDPQRSTTSRMSTQSNKSFIN